MNGIIIIDKPQGFTSRDVVNVFNKKYNTKKIGHMGTLDPLATGVLVLAINQGTKIIELLTDDDKEYIAQVKLGILTDTLDITGNIVGNKDYKNVTKDKLVKTLNSFLGKSKQEVPLYSAVRVNGERLYKKARIKEKVILPFHDIEIKKIELLNYKNDSFSFKVTVSKGTYIRSLIRDIGIKLNTYCTMTNLERIRQGIFTIAQAQKLDEEINVISLNEALENYYQFPLADDLAFKVINGVSIPKIDNHNVIVFLYHNQVLAIYKLDESLSVLKPWKVFRD